jgi:hypothetical protein
MQLAPPEPGSMSYFHHPGALADQLDDLVWWNCVYENITPPPDQWQKAERQYLAQQNVFLETLKQQSQRSQLTQRRPIHQTKDSLLLVIPEQADGAETVAPLLWSDLEAFFGSELHNFVYDISRAEDRVRLAEWLKMPTWRSLPLRNAVRPKPQIHIAHPEWMQSSEYETPTNLELLFYYPHRWFFRQKLRMYRSSLLSVTGDTTLLGSLAHRFFENLLKKDLAGLDRKSVQEWVNQEAQVLLPKEGATLLL